MFLRNFEKIANNIICGLIVPEKPLWGFNNKARYVFMYVYKWATFVLKLKLILIE